MGFFDKVKNMMSLSEDEYEEDDRIEEDDEEQEAPVRRERESVFKAPEKRNKVVNIHATTQLQVVLAKPEKFDDVPGIADHLNNKRTVVLNLEACDKDTSRRLLDFLSGAAYANRGNIKKVAKATYIIAPYDVDIMGDLILDELENSTLYI